MENVANTGKMKNTKIIVAIATVVLVVIAALIFVFLNKEEAYRSIQVYKVEGKVDVDRPQVGVLEAYANMMLQTLDIVNVSDNSNLQVKLDEDKYILLEPNTKIRLEAAGNSVDSKTKIYVEQGAIVCNIENKLSENSTYEVSTPNSTMAVRGTTFRVEVTFDEEGNSYTVAAVYEGVVESQLVYPNGEMSTESVSITAGSQAEIKGTEDDVEYIITGEDVTYEELEQVTLDFLGTLLDKGTELSITQEELTNVINDLNKKEETPATEVPEKTETEENTKSEETPGESTTPENTQTEVSDSTITGDVSGNNNAEASDDKEVTNDKNTSDDKTVSGDQGLTNNQGTSGNPGTSGDANVSDDTGASNDEDTSDDEDSSDDADDEIVEPIKYTVTFTYKEVVFATQTVIEGECATTPRLRPTPIGYWDYDFSQPIIADITLTWVDTTGQQ